MFRFFTTTFTGLLLCSTTALAETPSLVYLGELPGGATSSAAYGISGDGAAVTGTSESASGPEVFRWTSGTGMVGLGDLVGGIFSSDASAINADGSALAGGAVSANGPEAFLWTSGAGMVGLGDLAGGAFSSQAMGVSADGSAVVGRGVSAAGMEAFLWTSGTGMVGLGDLAGGIYMSLASDISNDGSVIVGIGSSANGTEAFRWTSGTGMVGLGDLAGGAFSSMAMGVSGDGTTVVGVSDSANGPEAFRWTSGTGMVGLGDLAGGVFFSQAIGTNSDGSIVVGGSSTASVFGSSAFIWDASNGMRDLAAVLTSSGVDLTGWELIEADDISDDGTRIVGLGNYLGNDAAYLAVLGSTAGVTTGDALAESLTEARVSTQQAAAQGSLYSSRGMFLARNVLGYFPRVTTSQQKLQTVSPAQVAPAAGDELDNPFALTQDGGYFEPDHWAFYTLGSFAMGQENNPDSHAVDGSVGVLYRADKNWIVGGGAISGRTRIDLGNGGKNILESYGGEIISSYKHPDGLRLYLIGFASYLTLDSSRGYMNGGGRSYSYGETEGYGYGVSARLGYEMDSVPDQGFTALPYIETEYSRTKLDGYTEEQGPFPARYSEQNGERVVGRIGVEVSRDVAETLTLRGHVAYARRLHDAEDSVTASSSGLTLALTPNATDDQWAEGGVSVLWQADENIHLSADISGRTGKTEDPYALATLGVSVGF